jgi:hypothetical protein
MEARIKGASMAKAGVLADETPAEKRVKTGGRPAKKSLDEMIANAERRGRLAALPDDTTVEAELAAFFLITSMSQLREYRKSELLKWTPDLRQKPESVISCSKIMIYQYKSMT